jgi:hypothetical protein
MATVKEILSYGVAAASIITAGVAITHDPESGMIVEKQQVSFIGDTVKNTLDLNMPMNINDITGDGTGIMEPGDSIILTAILYKKRDDKTYKKEISFRPDSVVYPFADPLVYMITLDVLTQRNVRSIPAESVGEPVVSRDTVVVDSTKGDCQIIEHKTFETDRVVEEVSLPTFAIKAKEEATQEIGAQELSGEIMRE